MSDYETYNWTIQQQIIMARIAEAKTENVLHKASWRRMIADLEAEQRRRDEIEHLDALLELEPLSPSEREILEKRRMALDDPPEDGA